MPKPIPTEPERRSSNRYRTLEYTAYWRRCGLLARLSVRREAAVLDFNRRGAALCSETKLKAGDRIELQMLSPSESLKGIQGTVRHVQRERDEFYCGIEFEIVANQEAATHNILACMEQIVENRLA